MDLGAVVTFTDVPVSVQLSGDDNERFWHRHRGLGFLLPTVCSGFVGRLVGWWLG
jgi:hypothetical protein